MKHDDKYWLKAAEDIKRFRKGLITMYDLMVHYPELNIQEDYIHWKNIKESIYINIPKECPLHCAAKIAFATNPLPHDVCLANRWLTVSIAYRPEWEKLWQVGELIDICNDKREVSFNRNYINEGRLVLRRCIKEGERADDYGIGTEPDTWLICELDSEGKLIEPFYIER